MESELENLSIRFLGSGDAFGSGGRLQACIFVDSGDHGFLMDCGASSLIAMKRSGVNSTDVDTILITHLHGDHFGGIPFFILDSQLISRRTKPLTIAGPPGIKERILSAMEIMFPGSSRTESRYHIEYVELPAGVACPLGKLLVTPEQVIHESGAPAYGLRIECAGRIIAYSGDTGWTDNLKKIATGADLFICEAYFYEKKIKFHLDYKTLISRYEELGCKRLILTHMGEDMLEHLDNLEVEYAEDGKIIVI